MTGPRVFESLDADWALVCAGSGRAEMVLGWLSEGGVLAEAHGLAELLVELECRDRARGRVHSDRWMRVLLARAAGDGDEGQLAARVVVQAMLPGAVRLTQRLRAGRDFDETGQVVVACLYQVVRRYPLWRRGGVAATLLLETLHMASRELKAESEAEAVPWHPVLESAAVPGEPAAADDPTEAVWRTVLRREAAEAGLLRAGEVLDGARGELVELLVWAVTTGMLDVVRARVIADEARAGARENAETAGVSAVTWRQRRSRTVRQLRPIADQWTQAA